jgi:hypothetical protein
MGWFKNLFSASVDKAADNILYHITSDKEQARQKNGKVFKEEKEHPLIEHWRNTDIAKQLWAKTGSLLAKYNF